MTSTAKKTVTSTTKKTVTRSKTLPTTVMVVRAADRVIGVFTDPATAERCAEACVQANQPNTRITTATLSPFIGRAVGVWAATSGAPAYFLGVFDSVPPPDRRVADIYWTCYGRSKREAEIAWRTKNKVVRRPASAVPSAPPGVDAPSPQEVRAGLEAIAASDPKFPRSLRPRTAATPSLPPRRLPQTAKRRIAAAGKVRRTRVPGV